VRVLRAGFGASPEELGLSQLRDRGYEITVVTVDQAGPGAPAPAPAGDVRLGDLRAVPIPPRSFDIVHCALLLDRIRHVELVLDRFIAALRPGGFLMLRIRDRDCAIGLLDRRLPRPARRLLQARLEVRLEGGDAPAPGRPGPRPLFPAVYERACSDDGIQEYARMRGLVITQRETARIWPDGPDRLSRTVTATCRLIARLTRGGLTDAHDEVLYVIRKPEDHFARIV
jgi:hypothetical protein